MKKWVRMTALAASFAAPAFPVSAGLEVAPSDRESLEDILQSLVTEHDVEVWCREDCAVIHVFRMAGRIADGKLTFDIRGSVTGGKKALVPLFSASPDVELLSLKDGDGEADVVFAGKAYHVPLDAGPFALTGEIKVSPSRAVNFTLSLPAGEVILDIPDQEPAFRAVPRGQVGGSFQILAAGQGAARRGPGEEMALRLTVERTFTVSRDKTFAYVVTAAGARPGQVISVPLEHGEKVLEVAPQTAKIFPDRVDFTATASEETFSVSGEWTRPEVELVAPSGAVKESWEVACEGANDCAFSGEVEKVIDPSRHRWAPLPGQKLTVAWRELSLLSGQSLVAQTALLTIERRGSGLRQTLSLELTSAVSDTLLIGLPEGAIPGELSYDEGEPSPVLRNPDGRVHLTVPGGDSRARLSWELPKRSGLGLPRPEVNLPAGKWAYLLRLNPDETVLHAGGPQGSPVVVFWPRLFFCFFLGALFLYAERRFTAENLTPAALFLIVCGGFALTTPLSALGVIALVSAVRLLPRARRARTVFGWFFEMGLIAALVIATGAGALKLLNAAFFSSHPLEIQDFCSWTVQQAFAADGLCWETPLTVPSLFPPAPYAVVVPLMAVRAGYFLWALLAGFFFHREFRRLASGLKAYFALGRRPVLVRRVAEPPGSP